MFVTPKARLIATVDSIANVTRPPGSSRTIQSKMSKGANGRPAAFHPRNETATSAAVRSKPARAPRRTNADPSAAPSGLLKLRERAVETEHHVQIGPVEFRAHGLLDVGARLLLDDELVHAGAQLQRTVAKLTHLRLARDVAMTGNDVVEVELEHRIERGRPLLGAAAAGVIDQFGHIVSVR